MCAAGAAGLERPRVAAAADLQQVAAAHSVALLVVDTSVLVCAVLVGTSQVARSRVPAGKRLAYKLAAGRRPAGKRLAYKQLSADTHVGADTPSFFARQTQ